MMNFRFSIVLLLSPAASLRADEASFRGTVLPFLKSYCIDCHSGDEPEAKFDLSGYTDLTSVVSDLGHCELVRERLESGEMPPEDEKQQPQSLSSGW